MDLNRPLTYIKKMTAKHAGIFHKNLNLNILSDLLYFFRDGKANANADYPCT